MKKNLCILFVLLNIWCAISLPQKRSVIPRPINPRIINGTVATMENTKHQVSLRRRLNDGYFFGSGHICGGSLIDYNVVLTANHCFLDMNVYNGTVLPAQDFIMVMGTLDRYEKTNETLIFDIEKIVYKVEGYFNVSTYEDDLALVFLNGSVPVDHPTVAPINYTHKAFEPDTICQVTGWGTTEEGYLSDKLMTVDVPIIAQDVCANETDFDLGMIIDGMVCAGYLEEGQKDACSGDSGGPMVCNGLQAGIVSWGIDCAQPRLPGVYTDVAYYARWIDEQLGRTLVEDGGDEGGNDGDGDGDDGGNGDNGDDAAAGLRASLVLSLLCTLSVLRWCFS